MKKLFFLSLLLNLGLVGALVYFAKQKKTGEALVNTAHIQANEVKTKRLRKVVQTTFVAVEGEKFHWRRVESADYKNYIANLRRIQCPEDTIRDIIVADVNKNYAEKLKLLRKPVEEWKFWRNNRDWGSWRESEEYNVALGKLEKEKRALLKELLGDDYERKMGEREYWFMEGDAFSKSISEETKDQISALQKRIDEKQNDIFRKSKGYLSKDEEAELTKLDKERRSEMAKILSPEELFEWNLRNSQTAHDMRFGELEAFNASEDEFRKIFKVKAAMDDLVAENSNDEDKATQDQREKREQEAEAQLKAALGEDRFKEYQLAQDYEYQELARIAQRLQLPKEAVKQVYDMKAEVEKAAGQINADKSLSPEEKREKLLAIKTVTENAAYGTLGNRGYKTWKRSAGWLREIIPSEPVAKN